MSVSYLEQFQHDPAFRAFVDAHTGRVAVELAALKVEAEHMRSVIEAQKARIAELEPKRKTKGNGV